MGALHIIGITIWVIESCHPDGSEAQPSLSPVFFTPPTMPSNKLVLGAQEMSWPKPQHRHGRLLSDATSPYVHSFPALTHRLEWQPRPNMLDRRRDPL